VCLFVCINVLLLFHKDSMSDDIVIQATTHESVLVSKSGKYLSVHHKYNDNIAEILAWTVLLSRSWMEERCIEVQDELSNLQYIAVTMQHMSYEDDPLLVPVLMCYILLSINHETVDNLTVVGPVTYQELLEIVVFIVLMFRACQALQQ
jgi:hypothetical protein